MDTEALHKSLVENINVTFVRSSGAGGQNVNKVNTKVHAAVPLSSLQGLTLEERMSVVRHLAHSINSLGHIIIDVQDERFQTMNKEIAFRRMESSIVKAAHIPRKRKKTKPTAYSKECRLLHKKKRSRIKKARAPLSQTSDE